MKSMKKIMCMIVALALAGSSFAQSAPNRTWKTKVSDALGLMPAPNAAEYDRLMGDLVSTGAEGVDMLVGMFDGTNNVPVSYALSGWSAFVGGGDREAAREEFAKGIVRGLAKSTDPEIKAFYIRLLQQCGKQESVAALAALTGDKRLGSPALVALASNGTPEAKEAIAKAVTSVSGDKAALAHAVGDAAVAASGIEQQLISWIGTDADTDKAVYYALSKIGTEKSLPVLRKAAEAVKYAGEPTDAADRYVLLVKKLYADGRTKAAAGEASKLMKKATAAGADHARIAALGVLSMQGKPAIPYIVKAMDDPSRAYRNSALSLAKPFADEELYALLVKKLGQPGASKTPEAQTDILTFLGNQGVKSAVGAVLPFVASADAEQRDAAMWAAARIGGAQVPAVLAEGLASADEAVVATAAACLAAYRGDVNDVLAGVLAGNASDRGKVAALGLLGKRGAAAKAGAVLAAAGSANPEIAAAACAALPGVVKAKDLPALYALLEAQPSATEGNAAAIQDAVIAAMKDMPAADRQAAVRGRMKGGKESLYYGVLARIGAPNAMEVIAAGFDNGTAAQKADAFAALRSGGMEASDKLIEIAGGDDMRFAVDALGQYINNVAVSAETAENKVLLLSDALDAVAANESIKPEMANRLKEIALQKIEENKTFQGLILAGKYLDDPDKAVRQAAAMAVISTALAHKEYYGPIVEDLLQRASAANEGRDSSYQREEVRKHLASLPKESGFVSMFNGKDLTGWKGLVENPITRAKMKPEELAKKQAVADETMRRDWKVNDGLLEFVGHGFDNICTKNLYRDFEMYVDWKLYAEGTEADAGIYLRGTPQVQMWDTSRRNVGAQVGSGGLYNNQVNPSTPSHVADNKLGTWNTFYIKMVGDRVTVVLNGEKVVDNVILENFWDRSLPIFPIEQIELQAHGTRVAYRNLYINELPEVLPTKLPEAEQKEGFKLLFDGTNMHGWTGNTKDYVSENGAIVLYPGNGGGGNLYTVDEYKDFVLRFDFMLTEGANNGIGIRAPLEGDAAYVGMEIQVLDNEAPIYSQLEKYQYHGSVYGVIPAKRGFLKPVGEWNSEEIRIKGDDIRVTLNGEVILEGNIAEASKNGTIDHKDHPGLKNEKGHIGFLGHGSVVKFKNIRLKELK